MNIVKEHINFERGLDPKDAMQVGRWKIWSNMERILLQAKKRFVVNDYSLGEASDTTKFNVFEKDTAVVVRKSYYSKQNNTITLDCLIFPANKLQQFKVIMGGPKEFDHYFKIVSDIKESLNFERGLDPKEAMNTGQRAVDQKLYDTIKTLPINDEWIKYFPKTKTKRIHSYIKIVLPLYWIMRKSAVNEIIKSIKSMNAPNIKTIKTNRDGDVLIKLKN